MKKNKWDRPAYIWALLTKIGFRCCRTESVINNDVQICPSRDSSSWWYCFGESLEWILRIRNIYKCLINLLAGGYNRTISLPGVPPENKRGKTKWNKNNNCCRSPFDCAILTDSTGWYQRIDHRAALARIYFVNGWSWQIEFIVSVYIIFCYEYRVTHQYNECPMVKHQLSRKLWQQSAITCRKQGIHSELCYRWRISVHSLCAELWLTSSVTSTLRVSSNQARTLIATVVHLWSSKALS